jgi:hypothetical protein
MAGPGPGSGLTLTQLRSRVKDVATFDEPDATIDQIANEKHKQLVALSGWDTRITNLGTTVTDQGEYDVPSGIADLAKLRVDSTPYKQVGLDQIWDLRNGDAFLSGAGGVFAPNYKADGTQQVSIYPTPDEDGLTIDALVTFVPATLGASDYPIVPEDVQPAIADGVVAELWRLRSENAQEAAEFENRFQGAIELLRRRKNSRIGTGPVQIGVKGVHFR